MFGVTTGPDSFFGKIGKMIGGVVSNCDVSKIFSQMKPFVMLWRLTIFSQLSANLFLCLVMKPFVMLVMTKITHAKFVGPSFTEL